MSILGVHRNQIHMHTQTPKQMVGASTTFVSTITASVGSSVADAVSAISGYAIWMVATTLLFSLLYVVQASRRIAQVLTRNAKRQRHVLTHTHTHIR